jgi:hypothetical protein
VYTINQPKEKTHLKVVHVDVKRVVDSLRDGDLPCVRFGNDPFLQGTELDPVFFWCIWGGGWVGGLLGEGNNRMDIMYVFFVCWGWCVGGSGGGKRRGVYILIDRHNKRCVKRDRERETPSREGISSD